MTWNHIEIGWHGRQGGGSSREGAAPIRWLCAIVTIQVEHAGVGFPQCEMSALHSGTAPTGSAAYSAGTPPGCPTVTSQTDTHWQQQPHGEPAAPATTNFAPAALKSNYVGVSWRHDVNKWEARIRQAGASQQRLGFFLTEEEARRRRSMPLHDGSEALQHTAGGPGRRPRASGARHISALRCN